MPSGHPAQEGVRERLLDNAQFLAHLNEGGDGFVQVLFLVGGTQLHADAGLALGHHGIIETRYEDPLFGHLGSKFLGQGSVVQHDGANGALGGLDVEAGGFPKVFFKYFYINTATGEKSAEMLVSAVLSNG